MNVKGSCRSHFVCMVMPYNIMYYIGTHLLLRRYEIFYGQILHLQLARIVKHFGGSREVPHVLLDGVVAGSRIPHQVNHLGL